MILNKEMKLNLDSDHLALSIEQLKNVILLKNAMGKYNQLTTLHDVYNILIGSYSQTSVNEIFIAHGFFGDKNWAVSSCNITGQGDKQLGIDETVGWGGREARSDLPLVSGSNIYVSLVSQTGQSVNMGFVTIQYEYQAPYDVFNKSIKRRVYNNSLFHIEPPPSRIPMTITVFGDQPQTQNYSIDNNTYWSSVQQSTMDYISQQTFTLTQYYLYLPIITR